MKASFYNHITRLNNSESIVFNKFHGSVSTISDIVAHTLLTGELRELSDEDLKNCLDNGFVIESNVDEQQLGRERFEENKATRDVLNIILELTRDCNFACSYCYQNNSRAEDTALSPELVQKVVLYVNNVLDAHLREVSTLQLNFIGGEPLLRRKSIESIISMFRTAANQRGIALKTNVDTNGYFLNNAIAEQFNSISVTITNEIDHDRLRPLADGKKRTFHKILENLQTIRYTLNNSQTLLNIRFNVNHQNYIHINELYELIQAIGIHRFKFNVSYTINYNYNERVNELTRNQFKKIYMEFLQFLAKKGQSIDDFPLPTFCACKAYIPYNLKIYSDGRLGLCDAFVEPIGNICDLNENIAAYFEVFKDYVRHNPYDDKQCFLCSDIGICGGKYFCRARKCSNDLACCDFLPYELDDYLRFFVKQYSESPQLFSILGE